MANINPAGAVMKVKHLLHCHVLLTGLSRAMAADMPPLPALEKLLAASARQEVMEGGAEDWLSQSFGMAQRESVPVAPYTALADGMDSMGRYCLRADPVCFLLLRDRVLFAGTTRGLAREEADALISALNSHFTADGLQFTAPHPDRWYLLLDASPALQAVSPSQALGRDVAENLLQGTDARKWRRWITEAQMVLHEHPVNLDREQRGLPPVNSVWPWGGGILERPAAAPWAQVWADDPLALGLAQAADIASGPLPQSAADLCRGPVGRGDILVVCEGGEGLECLEREWMVPLREQLQRGDLASIRFHLAEVRRVATCNVTRGGLWRFWRRPKSLETYLHG